MATTEIRMEAPSENETIDQRFARIIPFAIWEDEAMNSDDCHSALKEVVGLNLRQLSYLDSEQLIKVAEACTAYNWHLIAGALRGMAETRTVIGLDS
jgi:hypothetical protein